jgi:hypothetical protein
MIRRGFQIVGKAWDRFFFEPTSTAGIGLFRIVFGFVVFLSLLGTYPYRALFYTDSGIVSYATMSHFFPNYPIFYFRWLPAGDPALKYYFLALLFFSLTLTVGFLTRLSSILVFLGIISLSNRNFFVDNAGDDLMRINCFILMFSQAGCAYSIDRWWKGRGQPPRELPQRSPWAQRLLQLQLAYLYLNTVFLKLPGAGWKDGTALYYALNYLELKRFHFKYLFYYLWQIKLATYGVMLAEIAMGTLVWFRKFRYPVLAVAALLHFGINLTMQFPVFQYVMIASLIPFIYPEDIERLIASLLHRGKELYLLRYHRNQLSPPAQAPVRIIDRP